MIKRNRKREFHRTGKQIEKPQKLVLPEHLRVELQVILQEYQSLRDEIISLQEFTRQNITMTYTGIGVVGAITPFVVEYNVQFVFLLFPIFFLSIALTSTKYSLSGLTMGAYLKKVTIPKTRAILNNFNKQTDYSHILSWEEGKGVVRKYGLFYLPANSAHYWVILLAALLSLAAYYAFPPNPAPPEIFVIVALSINGLAFFYSIIVGLVAGFSR